MDIIERVYRWNLKRKWKREEAAFRLTHRKLTPIFDALASITPEELEAYAVHQARMAGNEQVVRKPVADRLWMDARLAFSLLWARQVVTDIQNAQIVWKK